MCRSFTDHIFAYLYIRERFYMLIYVYTYIYMIYLLPLSPKGASTPPLGTNAPMLPLGTKGCVYIYI